MGFFFFSFYKLNLMLTFQFFHLFQANQYVKRISPSVMCQRFFLPKKASWLLENQCWEHFQALMKQRFSHNCVIHHWIIASTSRHLFIWKCQRLVVQEKANSWSGYSNYICIIFSQLTACWPSLILPFRKSPDCGLYRRWREILKPEMSQF